MSRLPAELTRLAQGGEEDMRTLLGAIAATAARSGRRSWFAGCRRTLEPAELSGVFRCGQSQGTAQRA